MAATQFQTRTLTAILFVAVLVSSVLASTWSLFFLFLFFAVVGIHEFQVFNVGAKQKPSTVIVLASILLFALPSLIFLEILQVNSMIWSLLIVPAVLFLGLFQGKKKESKAAFDLFSLLYIILPFSLVVPITLLPGEHSPWLLLGYFFLLWANDTGAYLIGKSIGKRKLAPEISPGKTIEGFLGGVMVAGLVAYLNFKWIGILSLQQWLICALIASVIGTLGDLVESTMKRKAGVKDSGTLMPGHGGVLDRFDGLLLSLPVVFVYLFYIFMEN